MESFISGLSRIIRPAFMALILTALIFPSCKKEELSLLDTVPADATSVAMINLDNVLKSAGCQVKNGRLALTGDVSEIVGRIAGDRPTADRVADALQLIDRTAVVVFEYDGYSVMTFRLTDTAAATASVTASMTELGKAGDFSIYDCGGGLKLLVDGHQGWLTRDTGIVTAAVAAARTSSVRTETAIAQFLEVADVANIVCELPREIRPDGDYRLCMSATARESVLRTEITVMNPGGGLYPFGEGIEELSTDFLRYTPENTVAAVAAGRISSPRLRKSIATMLRHYADVEGMLDDIDGTVAVTVAPAAGSQALSFYNFEAWDYFAMVHMPQQKVDDAVDFLESLASISGKPVYKNGQYETVISDNMHGYFGNIDGYLAVSTREISGDRNNSLTDRFAGRRAAFMLDVPYGSELMKATGLPYGINLWGNLQTDRAVVSLKFNGSRSNILAVLAELAADDSINLPLP